MAELAIRPYDDSDEGAVLDLLAASLGKTVDERYRAFFRWKHLDNPFGRSFMWVAEVDGELAGFRSFLRWRFLDPGGEPVEAVRAVDTATSPSFRGLGVFRDLTLHGLDEMRPAGIQFVFNTPNDQSRPGYLQMGWRMEGRVPVKVRPASLRALWRMARSRTAAEPWSLPLDEGVAVADIEQELVDGEPPDGLAGHLVTERSISFLRWRYNDQQAVSSRAVAAGGAFALVRLRRRGGAVECTVGEVIGERSAGRALGAAVRDVMGRGGADYAIASASASPAGMVPAPGMGPIQTRRDVAPRAPRQPLRLALGDVELF